MFFGVLAVAAVLSVVLIRRRKTIWQQFAARHRLQYRDEADGPVVRGILLGRAFEMTVSSRSSDTDALGVQVVCMSVALENVPVGLEISSAPGLIGSLQKSLDEDAVALGDDAFDSVALLKSENEGAASEYLSPARKRTIESLIRESSPEQVMIKDHRLTIENRTMFSRLELLEQHSRRLVRDADMLSAE